MRIPIAKAPDPAFLLAFPGENDLPPELRDERIVSDAISWARRATVLRELARLSYRPPITVAVATLGVTAEVAEGSLDSVLTQLDPPLEIWLLHDDPISMPAAADHITIHLCRVAADESLAAVKNDVLRHAQGELVLFLDDGAELCDTALFDVARCLNAKPQLDALYTERPAAKGDQLRTGWSHPLLCGATELDRLLVVRPGPALDAGGFDPDFGAAHSFELVLRLAAITHEAALAPTVLRAAEPGAEPRLGELRARAVSQRLGRLRIGASAEPDPDRPPLVRVVPGPASQLPCVSVVVAGDGQPPAAVRSTLESLRPFAEHIDEVVVWRLLDEVVEAAVPFRLASESFAATVNSVESAFVLCLEAGVEPAGATWLAQLLIHAQFDETGVVAPAVIGADEPMAPSPLDTALRVLEVTGVAGNCVLVSQLRLKGLGGISPLFMSSQQALIDLSLRAAEAGFRNIVVADAVARQTNGHATSAVLDDALLRDIWGEALGRTR